MAFTASVAVKIYYGDEIRVTEVTSHLALLRAITSLFPDENPGQEVVIKYKDLDDDLVTIKREADFRFACINMGLFQRAEGQIGRRTMKVHVFPQGRPAAAVSPVAPLSTTKPAGDITTAASVTERGIEASKGRSYRLLARFVEHVTYPVNTKVLPGEEFTKVWRVRNDAEGPWPNDVEIIYVSGEAGDMMGSIAAFPQKGGIKPGETYDVSINLKACALPGTYEGFWRLRSISEGLKFGQRLRVCIQVENDTGKVENLAASDMEKLSLDQSIKADSGVGSKLCDDFECVDEITEGVSATKEASIGIEPDDVFVEVLPNDGIIPDVETKPTGEDGTGGDDHDMIKVLKAMDVEYSEYMNTNEMRHVKVAYGKLKKHVHHMVRQAQRRRNRKNQAKLEEKKSKQTKVA